jgi:hypothetical protein
MVQIMRMKIPMHNAEGLVRESKFRFNNKIAHLRKSDSIAVWGYNPATGVIDFDGEPFAPVNVLHRVDGTGGN